MTTIIKMENVTKKIKGRMVLDNITANFPENHIIGIRGQNGSGKTMLLRAIAGLIKTTGNIEINDKRQLANGGFANEMGILIENPGFLNEFTGYKNLELLALLNRKKQEIGDEITKTLKLVGLNPDDTRKYSKYSLGMKQRLGIAQAIIFSPKIVLLDEPTNAIDETGIADLEKLFLEMQRNGITIIIASHDGNFLEKITDDIFVMKEGRLTGGVIGG